MLILRAKRTPSSSLIRPLLNFTPLLLPRHCSSSSSFTVDYLISTFGFSPEKAARVYKPIAHLKSSEKPDSVIRFLNDQGFTEDHIKVLITWYPKILCSSPKNTLDPNLRALHQLCLSTSILIQVILADPQALMLQTSMPRIKFWRDCFNGHVAALARAFKFTRGLTSHDSAPIISLLKNRHRLSAHDIFRIRATVPGFMNISVRLIEDLLVRAEELGFKPGFRKFVSGLQAVMGNSREVLQKKMELLKSCGWSEDDFFSALRNYPHIVKNSQNILKTKMDFLMGEVRYDLSYIVSNPELLTCSLEKRLKPRHHVLRLLESKGLSIIKGEFRSTIKMTHFMFVRRYILPHKEIPGLHESYLAACARESK